MKKFCMGCMEQYGEQFAVCPHCGYVEGTQAEEAQHMEPGSILHGRYIVGRALGFGGFGVTYIAWDALLEQKVAIKEYLPSEFSTRMPGVTEVTVFSGDRSEQFGDGLTRFVEEARTLLILMRRRAEQTGAAFDFLAFLLGHMRPPVNLGSNVPSSIHDQIHRFSSMYHLQISYVNPFVLIAIYCTSSSVQSN